MASAKEMALAEELWQSVRREAETVAAADPVLAPSLATSILDHPSLASVLAFQIGQRLGGRDDERARLPVSRARPSQHRRNWWRLRAATCKASCCTIPR